MASKNISSTAQGNNPAGKKPQFKPLVKKPIPKDVETSEEEEGEEEEEEAYSDGESALTAKTLGGSKSKAKAMGAMSVVSPPRKTKKSSKARGDTEVKLPSLQLTAKDKAAKATDKVEDTMAKIATMAAPKDSQELSPLEKKVKEAFLGYAMGVLREGWLGATFRGRNARVIQPLKVKEMVADFMKETPNFISEKSAIPFVISSSHVDLSSLVQTYRKAEDLHDLQVKGRDQQTYRLAAMGGNHRRVAIPLWLEQITKERKTLVQSLATIRKKVKGAKGIDVTPGYLRSEQSASDDIAAFNKLLERGRRWVIAIYDRDKLSDREETFLAKNGEWITVPPSGTEIMWNEMQDVWAESRARGRFMLPGSDAWKRYIAERKFKTSKNFGMIMHNVEFHNFLQELSKYSYWRNGEFITDSYLKTTMRAQNGGFLMHYMIEGVRRLDEVTAQWKVVDVETRAGWLSKWAHYETLAAARQTALKKGIRRPNFTDNQLAEFEVATKEKAKLDRDIKAGTTEFMQDAWMPQVLEGINAVWVAATSELNTPEKRKAVLFDPYSKQWNAIKEEYCQMVLPEARKLFTLHKTFPRPERKEAMRRLELMLLRDDRPWQPIVTANVVKDLHLVLGEYKEALNTNLVSARVVGVSAINARRLAEAGWRTSSPSRTVTAIWQKPGGMARWIDPFINYVCVSSKKNPTYFDRSYAIQQVLATTPYFTEQGARDVLTRLTFFVLSDRTNGLLLLDTAANHQISKNPFVHTLLDQSEGQLGTAESPTAWLPKQGYEGWFWGVTDASQLAATKVELTKEISSRLLAKGRTFDPTNKSSDWSLFPKGTTVFSAAAFDLYPMLRMLTETIMYHITARLHHSSNRDLSSRVMGLMIRWAVYQQIDLPLLTIPAVAALRLELGEHIALGAKPLTVAVNIADRMGKVSKRSVKAPVFKFWDHKIIDAQLATTSPLTDFSSDAAGVAATRKLVKHDAETEKDIKSLWNLVKKLPSAKAKDPSEKEGSIAAPVKDVFELAAAALASNVVRRQVRAKPGNEKLPLFAKRLSALPVAKYNGKPAEVDPYYFDSFEVAKAARLSSEQLQSDMIWDDDWTTADDVVLPSTPATPKPKPSDWESPVPSAAVIESFQRIRDIIPKKHESDIDPEDITDEEADEDDFKTVVQDVPTDTDGATEMSQEEDGATEMSQEEDMRVTPSPPLTPKQRSVSSNATIPSSQAQSTLLKQSARSAPPPSSSHAIAAPAVVDKKGKGKAIDEDTEMEVEGEEPQNKGKRVGEGAKQDGRDKSDVAVATKNRKSPSVHQEQDQDQHFSSDPSHGTRKPQKEDRRADQLGPGEEEEQAPLRVPARTTSTADEVSHRLRSEQGARKSDGDPKQKRPVMVPDVEMTADFGQSQIPFQPSQQADTRMLTQANFSPMSTAYRTAQDLEYWPPSPSQLSPPPPNQRSLQRPSHSQPDLDDAGTWYPQSPTPIGRMLVPDTPPQHRSQGPSAPRASARRDGSPTRHPSTSKRPAHSTVSALSSPEQSDKKKHKSAKSYKSIADEKIASSDSEDQDLLELQRGNVTYKPTKFHVPGTGSKASQPTPSTSARRTLSTSSQPTPSTSSRRTPSTSSRRTPSISSHLITDPSRTSTPVVNDPPVRTATEMTPELLALLKKRRGGK
ncbi:hypothetical protein EIP91_007783 [Steccherinum ochraceum]|uniref:Uncharacterized protein n=1 Tax=Steccherinum ochraceum TaxID=92696 RepID=A0A4R0R3T9_9APHY|nr:hypothetical protein EIP91_007783 [Steccherinum ochraceum]